ncbi:MAG TPA: hypothetical protein VHP58_05645 [Alphaproteobacteria bacterium]|nr:hypothetical protein [Alphaproteobacteria bacterium]
MEYLTAPPTQKLLPPRCTIALFDVEANNANAEKLAVAGSAVAVGGAAFLWPEATPTPTVLRRSTFYRAITPKLQSNQMAQEFFQKHPHALAATRLEPTEPFFAGVSFLHWLGHLLRNFNRPLVLMSAPHSYDGAHLNHLLPRNEYLALQLQSRTAVGQQPVWHDVAETIAAHKNLTQAEASRQYHAHLPPLPHIADVDSLLQGFATMKALTAP